MMKTKQHVIWTSSIAFIAAAFALVGVAGVRYATAQVSGQPVYQNSADQSSQPIQSQQYDSRTNTNRAMDNSMSSKKSCKASDIIGMDVRAKSGDDNIGSINDLMISHDGRVEYLAVSFGGFLGMGDKLFAVPLAAVDFEKPEGSKDSDDTFARIDVSETTLKNKRGFDQDDWPMQADRSFLTSTSQRAAERTATPYESSAR